MGSPSFGQIPAGMERGNITIEAMKQVQADEMVELNAEQEQSQAALKNQLQEMVNPFASKYATRQKPIKNNSARIQKMQELKQKGEVLLPLKEIKERADGFQQRNPELKSGVLVLLRQNIKKGDTKEDILRKVREFYKDVTLADEALQFLLETTDGELNEQVKLAVDEFRSEHEREINAGRNISEQARLAAEKGLGTPTSLRDLYRDITGNPRDSATLYQQLSLKYAFKELKAVVSFLLHSLGADLKSKGPSIPKAELSRLFTETRSLQAIMGVYRFFEKSMHLAQSMFAREGLTVPPALNFESLTKAFMQLVSERYPSSDKVLQQAAILGVSDSLPGKIIAFTQLRNAVREVAINHIYRSVQHRDELYTSVIEALEDLEEDLEELMTKEEADDNIEATETNTIMNESINKDT